MRVLFFTDGSDDGSEAAKLVTRLLDRQAISYMAVVAVTWPQRDSPLWDKALDLQLDVDDLHAAMAITAARAVKQLRAELLSHAESVDEIITTGEPADATLKVLHDVKADIAILAVTSGRHHERIARWVQEVSRRAPCPTVVVNGVATEAVCNRG